MFSLKWNENLKNKFGIGYERIAQVLILKLTNVFFPKIFCICIPLSLDIFFKLKSFSNTSNFYIIFKESRFIQKYLFRNI